MLADPVFKCTEQTGSDLPIGPNSMGFFRLDSTTATGSSRMSCPYTICKQSFKLLLKTEMPCLLLACTVQQGTLARVQIGFIDIFDMGLCSQLRRLIVNFWKQT